MQIHRNRAILTMRTLVIFTGACARLLISILPLGPAGAAEITGRITVGASGAEILPGRPTSLPLKEVEVHVGIIERLRDPDALYGYVGSAYTDLDNFSRVHTRLGLDVSVASYFDTMPCSSLDPGLFVFGIDCLFIERGFYHDRDGDGLYGPDLIAGGNELVGLTRWLLPATEYRLGVPEIEGSRLRLHVENTAGDPMPVTAFDVAIQYDSPFEHANSGYLKSVSGDAPYEFPILVPGRPSRALITPITSGPETADPLVIESAFFHEQIDPFRVGGVPPILAEHSFVIDVPEPGMSASLLPALALLALFSDRRRSVPR